MRTIILIALMLFLLIPAASAEVIDRIVAIVNDDIITLHDVRKATVPYLLQQGVDPQSALASRERREAIFKEVLDDMVDRKLLVQEAQKINLTVSDQEVDQWLSFTQQQQGMNPDQFRAAVEAQGMNFDEYRDFIRQNLIRMQIVRIRIGGQISITEEQVLQEYRERHGSDPIPDVALTVSHMLFQPSDTSPEAKEKARLRAMDAHRRVTRLEEDFHDVAGEVGEAGSNVNQGRLGTFGRGDLDPELERVVFRLEEGETSGVFETRFGFHIVKVEAKEARASAQADSRMEAIYVELQEREVERLLARFVQNLRTRSFVDIRY